MTDGFIRDIRARFVNMPLLENEPMSAHTSFRIGGPARAMALPRTPEETAELVSLLRREGVRTLVMGNGTNLLCDDGPLELFVVKMDESMAYVRQEGAEGLRAGAGIPLARLAQRALEFSLGGLEFAHGIPGTLGGAVCMNAGAYGGEMKDVVASVLYVDGAGRIREKSGAALGLAYRRSAFSDTEDVVVESALTLRAGDSGEIAAAMRALSEKRRASQPLEKPSAGSTFKRPESGYAAALIDQAGLKGFAIGGAQVSEKHAGFVVNRGGATCADVVALMEHIRKTVLDRDGIALEPEVKLIR